MMIHQEWPKIKSEIDRDHLCTIGLILIKSWEPNDIGRNHQVLAYGYELNADRLKLMIYDPNTPGDDGAYLSVSLADPSQPSPVSYGNSEGRIRYALCFFKTNYKFKNPAGLIEETKHPLHVFLSHARADSLFVRELYERLIQDGIDAWLEEENIIPGRPWLLEIQKGVKNSDILVVCLSAKSITKEGFMQEDIRFALETADKKPDGTIFIIPARLEACVVPEPLGKFQRVDLFSGDGYEQLIKALRLHAINVGETNSHVVKGGVIISDTAISKNESKPARPKDIKKGNDAIKQSKN
jgi:hypothetical protein